ncbi:MAG: hypothetical protein KBA26_02575 [Candidatus Delongbacteria bacterium]|nr:hypothetical protein [Candidatus Delongbacteria bacterium]
MRIWLVLMISLSSGFGIWADDSFVLKNHRDGTVTFKILQVSHKSRIELDGILGMQAKKSHYLTSCWIMDAKTRKTVWKPYLDDLELMPGLKYSYEIEDEIMLDPGVYYIFFSRNQSFKMMISGLDELRTFIEDVIIKISDKDSRLRQEEKRWSVEVGFSSPDVRVIDSFNPFWGKHYFIDLSDLTNNIYRKINFEIRDVPANTSIPVRIYAQGEGDRSDREMFDYGWISNRQGDRIWEMSTQNTRSAGGATKNLRYEDVIRLPNGEYTLVWNTDDSHAFNSWNDQPPADPLCWGIVMELVNHSDSVHLRILDQHRKTSALVDLTKIRDNQLINKTFILNKPSSVRIIAYGEYSSYYSKMADYAWIIRKKDRVKVWEMTYQNSVWAGGSRKNRLFDDVIFLDDGIYEVYYVTDDTHAFDSWNDNPPPNPDQYGIQVFLSERSIPGTPAVPKIHGSGGVSGAPGIPSTPANPKAGKPPFPEMVGKPGDPIVQIIRVGSNKMLQERFTLPQATRIRVIAIGEGDRNTMYDYGWIAETGTGRIVWKMLYENTSKAGGVEKNRLVDEQIILDKGSYRLYYTTDDSHAFGDWNGEPPDHPSMYGIRILMVESMKN